jgi:hypothetical protein
MNLLRQAAPPAIDVPEWVHRLSDGNELPVEPRAGDSWWRSGPPSYFLLGLNFGLGLAYLVYHLTPFALALIRGG